jgi:uncharacterized protein YfbU (UPF0304 family)
MATITLRLEDGARHELEEFAAAHGLSVSEVLRSAIDRLLGRDVQMSRTDVPSTINMANRKLLSMLHELLARVPGEDDDVEYHRHMVEVLDNGYAGEYGHAFRSVHPELSRSDCELVWDVLDMFRVVQASLTKLSNAERVSLGEQADLALEFAGFDANDPLEASMLAYVRYLVSTDRWEEIATYLDDKHDRGNSHHRTLPSYCRMLAVYKPIYSGRIRERGVGGMHLGPDDLRQVVKAWPHPDSPAARSAQSPQEIDEQPRSVTSGRRVRPQDSRSIASTATDQQHPAGPSTTAEVHR